MLFLGGTGPVPKGITRTMPDNLKKLRGTVARRQLARYLLRDSERRLRLVTDNAPVAIAQCDRQARFKFVNRHYAERLGLTPEQVIGKPIPEVIGDKAWATFEPVFRECLTGKAVEFELPYQATDPQFTHCCYEPDWRNIKVVGLIAAITNITGLNRAGAALRESEATFRAMFEVSGVGKIEVEPASGRFLRANAAMCKFVGYSEAELLDRSVYDITYPEDLTLNRELCRRLEAGESEFDLDVGQTTVAKYMAKDDGRRHRAGGPLFTITPTPSRRSTCSWCRRSRLGFCMDFSSCCRRPRRFGVMRAERGACVHRRSWAGYTINMFEFEFPTGTTSIRRDS
jgi:PAS domain S-box-containing protein